MIAETYGQLLHNAAHWEFEITLEVLTAIPAYLWGRLWVKRHDRKHHHKDLDEYNGVV